MRLEPQQEENLIKQAQMGSQEAFDCLYKAYQKAVLGYIKGQVENESDAEDICQETWIWLYKRINDYNSSKGRFYTFIINFAGLLLRRYFSRQKGYRQNITLFTDSHISSLDMLDNLYKQQSDIFRTLQEDLLVLQEEKAEKIKNYNLLMEITFREGGPPHQLIVFGFSELIFPLEEKINDKSNRKSGYPHKVVEQLSNTILTELGNELEKRYIKYSGLPPNQVSDCLKPLRNNLGKKVEEIVVGTGKQDNLKIYLDEKIVDTLLKIYYGKNQ